MLEQGYDFYLADTAAGKSIHFGLRYQVYCLRERYEDPARYPNFLEQDEYDDASVHFLARCRSTGEWLGAMRLIIGPAHKLPVTRFCNIDPANFAHARWEKVAEASRLCTLLPPHPRSTFKVNEARDSNPEAYSHLCAARSLQTSWIALGLIRAARQYCLQHDITYGFFLISDPLARMLRRLGMDIEPVGSPCHHRGWRRPYIHNVRTGYGVMYNRSPELYKTFCQTIAYSCYSELDDSAEHVPLAAIG